VLTRLTASTVGSDGTELGTQSFDVLLKLLLSSSSLSVGVHARGECRFERTVGDTGAGVLKDRGVFILPNPSKEERLLLGPMAVRQAMTYEVWGSLTSVIDWCFEGRDSEVDADADADMEEV